MKNIAIDKSSGKGWFLRMGSQTIELSSLEVWSLSRVLKTTEEDVYAEILSELNPDGTN